MPQASRLSRDMRRRGVLVSAQQSGQPFLGVRKRNLRRRRGTYIHRVRELSIAEEHTHHGDPGIEVQLPAVRCWRCISD